MMQVLGLITFSEPIIYFNEPVDNGDAIIKIGPEDPSTMEAPAFLELSIDLDALYKEYPTFEEAIFWDTNSDGSHESTDPQYSQIFTEGEHKITLTVLYETEEPKIFTKTIMVGAVEEPVQQPKRKRKKNNNKTTQQPTDNSAPEEEAVEPEEAPEEEPQKTGGPKPFGS